MVTIIIFLLILGVLVFVHELGHFVMARRNGITAHEFGFGFPPRIVGVYKNEQGKFEIIWGNKIVENKDTIYSINLIPLGGFVKIKGEDGGDKNEADSFAGKSAWIRIKVLAAGVIMNFIFAWLVLSLVFLIGAPQDGAGKGGEVISSPKVQISQIIPDSPAAAMGLKIGDEILDCVDEDEICNKGSLASIVSLQQYISQHKGESITLKIQRGDQTLNVAGIPRVDSPNNQGPLGIVLAEIMVVRYPWYLAPLKGLEAVWSMIVLIGVTFGAIIKGLFIGQKVAMDVAGPVGIAYLTKQVTELGLIYIFNFAAILSINLGIINAVPFPALDGGRILFVLIEKIKGSPVSQKVEQVFHTFGFLLLILLMVLVTLNDFSKFQIIDKIKNIF